MRKIVDAVSAATDTSVLSFSDIAISIPPVSRQTAAMIVFFVYMSPLSHIAARIANINILSGL